MNTVLSIAVLLLSLLLRPRPYYFRYRFWSSDSTITREDFVAPLEKGLFNERAGLDTALVEAGRRIARQLAARWR